MNQSKKSQTRQDIESNIIVKAWKNESYKQELLANPKTIFQQEFGVNFPEELTVQVKEESPTCFYFVLPISPPIKDSEISEEELNSIAGGRKIKFGQSFVFSLWGGYLFNYDKVNKNVRRYTGKDDKTGKN